MKAATTNSGRFWAIFPAALLGSLVVLQLGMVRRILHDPSFSIEDKYYDKAVSWNDKMAQDRTNARLDFKVNWSIKPTAAGKQDLRVRIVARDGTAITGAHVEVDAFAIARANQVVHGALAEVGDGEYHEELPLNRAGQWELALSARRAGQLFTEVTRRDLSPGVRR
jgi:hypothetical protein